MTPRVRGRVALVVLRVVPLRMTPADAGTSSCCGPPTDTTGDDPRGCGDKVRKATGLPFEQG